MFSQASHNSRTTPIAPHSGGTELIARVNELIADLKPDRVDLLKAFHLIQHEYGYVPKETIPLLAGKFDTTPAIVFGTIDFYSEVHTTPPAEQTVDWCSGPACLMKGSTQIRGALEAVLGCEMNRTTDDGKFGLRLAQCDGTCHLAPLIKHDGRYLGPLTTSDTIAFARNLKGEPSLEERVAAAQAAAEPEEDGEASAE